MWVGSTESNLERILKILSALTPVGVVIDEADAALGNRDQQGDSGTQNRVFAQIAAFMGDTRNRGNILWFLITARPDLLPIDLKRQGRAEEHIPLFYPETAAEYDEIYGVMLKKLGIKTAVDHASPTWRPRTSTSASPARTSRPCWCAPSWRPRPPSPPR